MCTGANDIYRCGCTRVTFDEPCSNFRCVDWKTFEPRRLERGCYTCNSRRDPVKELGKHPAPEIITSKPDTTTKTNEPPSANIALGSSDGQIDDIEVTSDIEVRKQEVMEAIKCHIAEGFAKMEEEVATSREIERKSGLMALRDVSDGSATFEKTQSWLMQKAEERDLGWADDIQEIQEETVKDCLDALLKL